MTKPPQTTEIPTHAEVKKAVTKISKSKLRIVIETNMGLVKDMLEYGRKDKTWDDEARAAIKLAEEAIECLKKQ